MSANVINGTDLVIFITTDSVKKCIALATSCKIAVSMATREISSKDSTGNWHENAAGKLSWTCDSDNLFTQDYDDVAASGSGVSYSTLMDLQIARTPLEITFGQVATEGMGYQQTVGTEKNLTGTAYITSIDLNAPNDENSTFSISMIGTGALTHAVEA